MRYILYLSLLIIAASCMHGRTGSGNIVTETRSNAAFTGVHASGGLNVHLKTGPNRSVTVEADDNIIQFVETRVSGNVLNIRVRELTSLTNVTINVYVTAPSLTDISASAGADIDSKDMISANERITVKGSSGADIELSLDAPSVTADGSSADIKLSGRTKDLVAEASSSASIEAYGLQAENVVAKASSSADISVFGSVSINGSASSSGSVTYKGGATDVKKNESSSGSVDPAG